jgi:RNA polymerase sigma factor (sigma-70 family)
MATGHMSGVLQQLRRAVLVRDREKLSDGQLLEFFLRDREEAAFETLVRRHGPMVLGVCRRVLGHSHDAEDAFQAAFLVLVRKAASIRPRELVGNWLYGVACRTARKAKTLALRRQAREKQVSDMPAREANEPELWSDLRPLLDQELQRLSDNYRAAVVLCDLEGKSRRQAARQLGWPEGTLSSRLMRGRKILARRLTRRGLALTSAGLALALSQHAATACVPAPLLVSTIKAATLLAAGQAATPVITTQAAALTEGVLQAMFLTKIKGALTVLAVVAFVGTGAGLLGHRGGGADAAAPSKQLDIVNRSLPPEPITTDAVSEAGEEGEVTVAVAQRTAAPVREGRRAEVHGMVKEVNASARTITISVGSGREAAPEDKTFAVAKDVEVVVGSSVARGREGLYKEAKLADLAAGLKVALTLAKDEKTVDAILTEGPMARGQVKAVDADKKTITIGQPARGRDGGAEEKTYSVAAKAEIAIDDGRGHRFSIKEGTLADVAVGALVTAQLSLDSKHIQVILAEGPTVAGAIKSIDPAKKSLTLVVRQPRGDDAGDEQTLTLADHAMVLVDDGKGRRLSLKQRKLADLAVGVVATAKLSVDQALVMSLRIEGPTVAGLLKGVDPEKGLITISIPKGRDNPEEKTFAVAKDVRIMVDGGEAKLGDLKPGDNGPVLQLRLTLDQQAVQAIVARQARGR